MILETLFSIIVSISQCPFQILIQCTCTSELDFQFQGGIRTTRVVDEARENFRVIKTSYQTYQAGIEPTTRKLVNWTLVHSATATLDVLVYL